MPGPDAALLAYITFTALLVFTPGATTAVVVRHTIAGGATGGFAAAAGAAVGNSSHAAAAGLGLALIFTRWPAALLALRVAGGCYLAWLGVISLLRAYRQADGGWQLPSADNYSRTDAGAPTPMDHGFRQGLAVNLLNPAIATFYLVVVPSFVPATATRWSFITLAAIHILMAFTAHSLWVMALGTVRHVFASPRARRVLEGATGLALVLLAIGVLMP